MAKNAAAQAAMNEYTNDDENEAQGILEYSTNIEEAERPPVIPVGEYRATLVGVERKTGKESGRPYLNLKWKIGSDNLPADYVESLGAAQDITVFGMVFGCEDNPQSRYNMKQLCKAIGAPMSNRIDTRDFVNREAKVSIRHGKDLEGNPSASVGKVSSAD